MFCQVIHQTATHSTLLARVAAGTDPQAWREFCARYGELIRGFCLRRGLQAADIDDVQQDVMAGLVKAMPGFVYDPLKGRFRSYLKTVVLHVIYRRSFQKRGAVGLSEVDEATRVGGADESIDKEWESQWRQYHLRRAMQTIEPEFAESDLLAFERYAVLGHDAAEVAGALGVSADSIYQAKSRILKRLSAVIELQVQEEG